MQKQRVRETDGEIEMQKQRVTDIDGVIEMQKQRVRDRDRYIETHREKLKLKINLVGDLDPFESPHFTRKYSFPHVIKYKK